MHPTNPRVNARAHDDLVDTELPEDEIEEDESSQLIIEGASLSGRTGFDKRAFDNRPIEQHPDVPPLPNDDFPDILGKFEQVAKVATLAIKFGFPPLGIGIIVLGIIAYWGWHRQAEIVTHEITVYCHDGVARSRTQSKRAQALPAQDPNAAPPSSACNNKTVALSTLLDLTRDQQAQILVSQGMLPVIIHSAFTIDSADTNEYNWANFVLPYLDPNSQAASYLNNYLSKIVPGQIAQQQSVAVRVDSIGDPPQPNTYTVGWVAKVSNGYTTKYQHVTATITITFGPKTSKNSWGLYVTSIGIDDHGDSNANEWNSLSP